jgi:cytoskeletal protein CcmA (bactofilin family)
MAAGGSTVLGRSIVIRGEITGAEDLVIDGKVDGVVTLKESRLTVGPNADLHANLDVHDAVLLGRCEGNITATGRVELRKGAALVGDLSAARVSMEDGAALQGKVSMTGGKE